MGDLLRSHYARPNTKFLTLPLDLVALLASGPAETDRVACVFDLEAGLQGAEGDFAALRGDR
jgi:hypothetical protein